MLQFDALLPLTSLATKEWWYATSDPRTAAPLLSFVAVVHEGEEEPAAVEAEATTAVEVEAAAASATTKAAASTGEFTLMLLHFVALVRLLLTI